MTKLILLKQLLYSLKYSQPYILSECIFNRIIFYANAGNVRILDMLKTRYTTSLQLSYCQGGHFFTYCFKCWARYSLCFFNRMKKLMKIGLSFVLPLFYLSIIAVLIILCHFLLGFSRERIVHSSTRNCYTLCFLLCFWHYWH